MGLFLPYGRCGCSDGAASGLITGGALTDRIALVLAGLIALGILADFTLNQGATLLFLARKMIDLIALVSIWR